MRQKIDCIGKRVNEKMFINIMRCQTKNGYINR